MPGYSMNRAPGISAARSWPARGLNSGSSAPETTSVGTVIPDNAGSFTARAAVSVATFREAAQLGELRDGVDPDREAPALYFLAQGLVGPILIGLYDPEEALALIDAQLDRVFRAASR